MATSRIKIFSLARYVSAALEAAEYERDESDAVIGKVPNVSGFFSQGETYEEARSNLREVIEGNILVALQLGWDVPSIPGVDIEEQDVEANTSSA